MTQPFGADILEHYGAGVTVSLGDYAFWRLRSKKEDRIEMRRDCLDSIETILDAQDSVNQTEPRIKLDRDSVEYALNVAEVKRYFATQGIVQETSVTQRLKNHFSGFWRQEWINPLNAANRLYLAMVLEVGETVVAWQHYSQVAGDSPIAAMTRNIYQVPAFWIGLMTGKPVRSGIHYCTTSAEEKKLDKTIKNLAKHTNIISIVESYEPASTVEKELSLKGTNFAQLAAPFSKGVKLLTDGVANYSVRKQEKETAVRAERQSKFDELTKGR